MASTHCVGIGYKELLESDQLGAGNACGGRSEEFKESYKDEREEKEREVEGTQSHHSGLTWNIVRNNLL